MLIRGFGCLKKVICKCLLIIVVDLEKEIKLTDMNLHNSAIVLSTVVNALCSIPPDTSYPFCHLSSPAVSDISEAQLEFKFAFVS